MKKGFLKTAFSVMLLGSVVALTSCHESASVYVPTPVIPVGPVAVPATTTTVIVSPVDLTGAPIPGATVTITMAGQTFPVTADANGNFTFEAPVAYNGAFVANVKAAGYNDGVGEGQVVSGDVAYIVVYMSKDATTAINDGNATSVDPTDVAGTDFTDNFVTETTLPTTGDDGTPNPDAPYTQIGVGIFMPSQTIDEKVLFVPFYDPDVAVAAMTRAETKEYLYCGIRAYLQGGADIKSGKTLQQPVTITFAVSGALQESLLVKKLTVTGQWIDVPNVVKDAANDVVKVTDTDLTYYGLFFNVTKNEVEETAYPFVIVNKAAGPFSTKSFNYTVPTGVKQSAATGNAFGQAFLKSLATRDYGRVGRDFMTRNAVYNYSYYPLSANQWLQVTAEQARVEASYQGAGAAVTVEACGNITVYPLIYTVESIHSGGIVDGE